MSVRRDVSRGHISFWGPLTFIILAGACVGLSMRARPLPASAREAVAKAADHWKGLQMEADTSHLTKHHLWITIRVPAGPREPAHTIRYDAYRQVLSHYGDARKIPLSFTVGSPL
jgi:hypothetical protein